jgi:HSP20 family protein
LTQTFAIAAVEIIEMQFLLVEQLPFLWNNLSCATARMGDRKDEPMTVAEWAPLVDITEDDKEYLIKAELPDVKKEDVKVAVENGRLTITGERKFEKEESKKYHRVERLCGRFVRSFIVPDIADADKVSAEFADSVLKVHLPKSEKAKPDKSKSKSPEVVVPVVAAACPRHESV